MKEIIEIAEVFVNELNQEEPFHPDYRYGFCDDPEEFFECWYFDFKIIPNKNVLRNKLENFGGAPGFVITKSEKKVKMIGWEQKHELEEEYHRIIELDKMLQRAENEEWDLALVRKLTGLKPITILEMKAKYQSYDFSKKEKRFIVIKEFEKLMKENNYG